MSSVSALDPAQSRPKNQAWEHLKAILTAILYPPPLLAMEYLYSTIVDRSTYETEGLCDGIDVRKSSHTEYEDRGAIRTHEDWAKYIQPCREYRGTLGPHYSFMSVAVPECIPERLEIISYANEFAFMHDGRQLDIP